MYFVGHWLRVQWWIVPWEMSDTSIRGGRSCIRSCCSCVMRQFNLNGYLSYAFIYGTWEIIRARKVGTTHTKVDYVVYRLFYSVILVGTCLFAVVAEKDLTKFFTLIEIWCMIFQIMYAFIFLQNVLANNIHRENVKHRQKIPERLVVTDEIEKGGHNFYICKRYSILPTEKLYYTERFIWLLFNALASINTAVMLSHASGFIELGPLDNLFERNDEEQADLRAYAMGMLILADVFLTPIPIRWAHVIFPLLYLSIYECVVVLAYSYLELAKPIDMTFTGTQNLLNRFFAKCILIIIIHSILTGLGALRDYVISLLDDSRTPKQLQNLRSQKRLARRKLMNYIEAPDGHIVEITLEKRSYTPRLDEYIKTDKKAKLKTDPFKAADDSERNVLINNGKSHNDGEGDNITEAAARADDDKNKGAPLTAKIRPPPPPRYRVTPASSSDDEITVITKAIDKLPSPPKDSTLIPNTPKRKHKF